MKTFLLTCDRCGKVVDAGIDQVVTSGEPVTVTSGYYIVSEGNWQQFQRWEEENVCDDCMHSDPKYIAIYGDLPSKRIDPQA